MTRAWKLDGFRTFNGKLTVKGRRNGRPLVVSYQCVPAALSRASRYRDVLLEHGAPAQARRPDLTLKWRDGQGRSRLLLIESKLGQHDGEQASRRALADLLSYRREFVAALDATPEPYGLGVAWGLGLAGSPSAEVMLCSPEHVAAAVARIVKLNSAFDV